MPRRQLPPDEIARIEDEIAAKVPAGFTDEEIDRWVKPRLEQALGIAENTPAPLQGSSLARALSGLWGIVNPIGLVSAVRHPIDTAMGIGAASMDQAAKAKEAFGEGRYVEAVGHGAGAVPIFGTIPAQIGEQIAEGDVAGGLGAMAGVLLPAGLKKGLEVRTQRTGATRAPILEQQAAQQVSERVLAPGNPKFKARAAAIAPEVLKRDLSGGRPELVQAAHEIMDQGAAKADAAIQAAGGLQAPVPVNAVIARLQQSLDGLRDSTGKPLSDRAAQRIKAINKRVHQLKALGKRGGTARFDDLRGIRDESYGIAEDARGYELKGNPAMSDEGWAARETGGAIREIFAQRSPEAAAGYADYSFGKTLADILDPAVGRPKTMAPPAGVTGGARTTGAVAGMVTGSPVVTFALSVVLPKVKEMMADASWQLASAKAKMQLAERLRAGDLSGAQKALTALAEVKALTTSPSESRNRTTAPALPLGATP